MLMVRDEPAVGHSLVLIGHELRVSYAAMGEPSGLVATVTSRLG